MTDLAANGKTSDEVQACRIGYIVVAHHLPGQLGRLVRLLSVQGAPIVVHFDRRTLPSAKDDLHRLERETGATIISTRSAAWGHFSLVEAIFDAMREMLQRHPDVTHVKHLSGQDYPIRPLAAFAAHVKAAGRRSIIDCTPLPSKGRESQLDHLRYRYLTRRWRRYLRIPIPRSLPDLAFCAGSAFWCLERSHGEYMLQLPPRASRFFRGCLAPDELFIQTMLYNSPRRSELDLHDLTYTSWRGDTPSPEILTLDDWTDMQSSDAFFARKFDPRVDMAILDRIDEAIR